MTTPSGFPRWTSRRGRAPLSLRRGRAYDLSASASVLAKAYSAPLLLTHTASLDAATITELQRLNPSTVYLVGLSRHHLLQRKRRPHKLHHQQHDGSQRQRHSGDHCDRCQGQAGIGQRGNRCRKRQPGGRSFGGPGSREQGLAGSSLSNKWATSIRDLKLVHLEHDDPQGWSRWERLPPSPAIQSQNVGQITGTSADDLNSTVAWWEYEYWGCNFQYTGVVDGTSTNWAKGMTLGAYLGRHNGVLFLSDGENIASQMTSYMSWVYPVLDSVTYDGVVSPWTSEQACALWQPQAPRHTTYDLGDFADHNIQAVLDSGSLGLTTTDLDVASFGPDASLTRSYFSTDTTSPYFATGWHFSFERKLVFDTSVSLHYVDASGDAYEFVSNGGWWLAAPGYSGSLTKSGSNWVLSPPEGNTLTFDSTGKLISEADGSGNTVTYTWTTSSITIKAANGQQVVVSLNSSGKATQAVYSTSNGTRTVTYATAAPWTVTYSFSGGTSTPSRSLTYSYTSNLLTGLTASAYTSAGDSTENFSYTGSELTGVTYPDHGSNSDSQVSIAYNGRSAVVTGYGRVYSPSAITGTSGTAVSQTFTWNPSGTMASKTNEQTQTDPTQTWTYTYSPGTNYLLSQTSPLGLVKVWTYNNHGNVLSETDEAGHTTTYSYPDSDPGIPRTIQVIVGAGDSAYPSSDDAFDMYSGGTHTAQWTTPYDAVGHGTYVDASAWTFRNINIPQGSSATITSAYITLYAQSDVNGSLSNLVSKLGLEKATTAYHWNSSNDPATVPMTTNVVTNWRPSSWSQGNWYNSPDLSAAVQEVTNQSGWAPGNAMAVLWRDNGTAATNLVDVGDYSNGTPAILTISYLENPTPNRDNASTVTDPKGSVTSTSYDSTEKLNQTTKTVDTSGTLTATDYLYGDVTAMGGATYHGATIEQKDLITGTPASGTWKTTDMNTGTFYPNGQPNKIVYRAVALQNGQQSPGDLTVTQTFDNFGNELSKTDTAGNTVETNTYDLDGNVLTSTGAPFTALIGGNPTTTQLVTNKVYDAWGHVTQSWTTSTADQTGTKDDWTTATYDASGRESEAKSLLSDGTTASTVDDTYDGLGRLITETDSTVSGLPALKSYDAQGDEVASWAGGACTTQEGYLLTRATRQVNTDMTPAYDAVGEALSTTLPGQNPTTFTYTYDNHILKQTKPEGTWVQYSYDPDGDAVGSTTSNGSVTSATYDLAGRLTSSMDANGLVTNYIYDLLGRETSAAASGNDATTYVYNVLGWKLKIQDPDGFATTGVYDSVGNELSETVAGATTTNTYYGTGQLTHTVDSEGRTTDYTYDAFGNTIEDKEQAGSPLTVVKDTTAVYDSLGRVTSGSDSLRQISHAFTYPANTTGNTTGYQGDRHRRS